MTIIGRATADPNTTITTDWRARIIDIHPADVRITDQDVTTLYPRARARRNASMIEVWVENSIYPHVPMLAFTAPIETIIEDNINPRYPRKQQYIELTVAVGLITVNVHIQPLAGCGCGSRLKVLPPTVGQQPLTAIEQTLKAHFPNAVVGYQ
ncbi:MAG TPA: hypothetical protein VH187_22300 [Scandinavium sp.]|jgi:hypothetical protein|uniref:hypothetical protein n=1 Tax=Scandinavium sp. TaxID=2830653 RepID=UPI002E371065|nr:hypothetical protein [Scandinavium sp.]HEX4503867.1 hypothetical protein [Scandinavium sp.]